MINGITISFDGQPYIVPPLSLGALEDMEVDLASYTGKLDKISAKTVIDSLFLALLRNYPDITRDQVRKMVGLENMHDVMLAVIDVSGLRRKELEVGEPEPVAP